MTTRLIAKIDRLKNLRQKRSEVRRKRRTQKIRFTLDWDGSNPKGHSVASPLFKSLMEPARYKVYFGGRGGAKSRTFARILLLLGGQKQMRILCCREVMLSLADSVHKLLCDEVQRLGLGEFYTCLKSQVIGANGTEFLYSGLRSQSVESVKSIEGIDVVWVEESHTISQHSLDILIPTIRKPGSEIWFSFNPRFESDPVYKMFVAEEPPPNSVVQKINYDSNRFFPEVLQQEMEWLRGRDMEKYLHVWEGNCITLSEARIFRNWEVREFDTPKNAWLFFGVDFGMSADASCVIGCWFDDAARTIYIDRESYENTTDIAQLPALLDRCPGSRDWDITYDSSRPELGKELKKYGFRMKPARKGPGSVMEGILYLQSLNMVVHPRCKQTIYELSHYSYKTDRHTDEVIQPAVPEDKNNHLIDSLRYSCESRWRKQSQDWIKARVQ